MTKRKCSNCDTEYLPDKGIIVGAIDGQEDDRCTICYAQELRMQTVLSDREAEIAAHKRLTDASHATIAKRIGISEQAVNNHSRQMTRKLRLVEQTKRESSGLL